MSGIANTSIPTPASAADSSELHFWRAREIASGLGISKRQLHNRAKAAGWPQTREANRIVYAPPAEIVKQAGLKRASKVTPAAETRGITFVDLSSRAAREKVLARQEAVVHFKCLVNCGVPARLAGVCTRTYFASHRDFSFSSSSLRRWVRGYELDGIDGLVEQKAGRVGRKKPSQTRGKGGA